MFLYRARVSERKEPFFPNGLLCLHLGFALVSILKSEYTTPSISEVLFWSGMSLQASALASASLLFLTTVFYGLFVVFTGLKRARLAQWKSSLIMTTTFCLMCAAVSIPLFFMASMDSAESFWMRVTVSLPITSYEVITVLDNNLEDEERSRRGLPIEARETRVSWFLLNSYLTYCCGSLLMPGQLALEMKASYLFPILSAYPVVHFGMKWLKWVEGKLFGGHYKGYEKGNGASA